jgi:hypothetical protein
VLLAAMGPLFLHMPLIDDAALFDLHARCLANGHVLYRDVFETNLPGMVWIHGGVRALLGPSSLGLRAFDLVVFSSIVFLLAHWLRYLGAKRFLIAWTTFTCFLFYFCLSEWCHCQRDVWLLLPGVGGLSLRIRQVVRCRQADAPDRRAVIWAMAEGICWGTGVWIKPLILVPAFACWLYGLVAIRDGKAILWDSFGLLLGGAAVGFAGIAWMVDSGAWPHFVEIALSWNPQYFAARWEHWTSARFVGMLFRMSPWMLILPIAVPASLITAARGVTRIRLNPPQNSVSRETGRALFAVFYLAWLGQSFFLQRLFDYVHAPGVLLSVVLIAGLVDFHRRRLWRMAAVVFLAVALASSPTLNWDRLATWGTCVAGESTPVLQDRLKLLAYPDWSDLHRVADFLRKQDVRDRETNCFQSSLVHLYGMLDRRPATRFVFLEHWIVIYPERHEVLRQALAASPQRFVVTDLVAAGIPPDRIENLAAGSTVLSLAGNDTLADAVYPWSYPIVFRSGRYAVHRVDGPVGVLRLSIDM